MEDNLQIDPALRQGERQPVVWPNEEKLQQAITTTHKVAPTQAMRKFDEWVSIEWRPVIARDGSN